jgi:hypothetical protein
MTACAGGGALRIRKKRHFLAKNRNWCYASFVGGLKAAGPDGWSGKNEQGDCDRDIWNTT